MDIMPEKQHITPPHPHRQAVSGRTAVLASIAGLMVGGPLLGLMGISFAATMSLLLVTAPLFVIFSPVLFGAACVFGLTMLGLAFAGASAVAGVWALAWVLRPSTSSRAVKFGEGEMGKDWAGYVQPKPYHHRENALLHQ